MVKANNFQVDKDGRVWINAVYDDGDPNAMVGRQSNQWEEPMLLDTLKVVEFEIERFLEKQGSSLYRETGPETNNDGKYSGPPTIMAEGRRPKVLQGFVESSNVDPVVEMVQMIEINRAYEANQKVIQTEDSALGTLISQVMKLS
jgi:flagellar basal-body rod protein FlgG